MNKNFKETNELMWTDRINIRESVSKRCNKFYTNRIVEVLEQGLYTRGLKFTKEIIFNLLIIVGVFDKNHNFDSLESLKKVNSLSVDQFSEIQLKGNENIFKTEIKDVLWRVGEYINISRDVVTKSE